MSDSERDGTLPHSRPSDDPDPDLESVRLIVERINEGHEDAWPQLNELINNYLTLMAEKNMPRDIRGRVNPSDIVQQTMMEVVKGIDGFRGQSTPEFFGWLNQILRNQSARMARDLTRQKRDVRRQVSIDPKDSINDPGIELTDQGASPRTKAIDRERLDLMERALASLPEEYEQVVRWRNFEELSYEQIAEKMNRSVGAVSKLWYRAMVRLKEELARLENETRQ